MESLIDQNGKVYNLAGLVDYQPGTVVSRTIIKQKTGTTTLFAFDKGEELSEHTAPFDAMVVVLDGQVTIRVAEHEHLLSAGEMIVMPANRPHAVTAIERFKMLLIMIKS